MKCMNKKIRLKILMGIVILLFSIEIGLIKIDLTDDVKALINGESVVVNTKDEEIEQQLNLFVVDTPFNSEPNTNEQINLKEIKTFDENNYKLLFDKATDYEFYLTNGQTFNRSINEFEYSNDNKTVDIICKNDCDLEYNYVLIYSKYFEKPYALVGLNNF